MWACRDCGATDQTLIATVGGLYCRVHFNKRQKAGEYYGLATYEADKDPKPIGRGRETERA